MVGFAWLNLQMALEMRKREGHGGAERGITAVGNVMPRVPLDMIGLIIAALALRRHLRVIVTVRSARCERNERQIWRIFWSRIILQEFNVRSYFWLDSSRAI